MKFFARRSDEFHASQVMISSYLDSALSNKDMEKIKNTDAFKELEQYVSEFTGA